MSLGHRTYIIEGDSIRPFDTLRLAVREDGSLDQDHYRRRLADIFAAVDAEDPAEATMARERRSPQISEEARKRILVHLNIQ
jgi:thioredoxin-like negative regulator of GroEL